MTSLQDLSSTICKVPQHEIQGNTYVLEYYPEISLSCELNSSIGRTTTSVRSIDSWRNVMIPVNEGVLKRITRTFFESGSLREALDEARDPRTVESSPVIASLAEYTVQILDFINKLKTKVFPHSKELGVCGVASHTETRCWEQSNIRCIVWHPNCFKIAVAGRDDVIRIYTDEHAVVPVLRSASQKWITSMAWRPFCPGELAVGCEQGICLWIMDSSMHVTRTSSQTVFLKHPRHCPITSVQWSADGSLLASASIGDPDVIIWNVDKMQNTSLKRVGPPCSLLKWSPDGSCLFSATVGNVFRVWSADNDWTPERWTINAGTIQSACWSPCSSYLLFVTTDDPFLYSLQFFEEQLFRSGSVPKAAYPIADLSRVTVGQRVIGGCPQALTWDPNGHNLAVSFKDSPCVAIFNTCVQKFKLSISPACFLSGVGSEFPSFICFQSKNRKNSDSVLTVGWSSGRIQYIPFGIM